MRQKLQKTFPETGATIKFSHIIELKVPRSSISTKKFKLLSFLLHLVL